MVHAVSKASTGCSCRGGFVTFTNRGSFFNYVGKTRYRVYRIEVQDQIEVQDRIEVKDGIVLLVYRKVVSSSLSRLVAHFQIFRRLMKGKFDAYVL